MSEPIDPVRVPAPGGPPNVQPIAYSRAEGAVLVPWNGLAIASLVLSVIGLGLVGVILGHIAMAQIKRTGERGWVLALVGVILGYLGILVWVLLAVGSILWLSTGQLITNYP